MCLYLVRRINSTYNVALAVVDDGPPPTSIPRHHHNDRNNGADNANNHQYPAHFVDVEAVLIWLRYRPIENRPYGKTDDAYNEPASPNHGAPFLPVAMAVPLLMSSQTILKATG